MVFDISMAYASLDFWNILATFGLFYNLYYIWDFECELEKHLYDLSIFCFDHDCSGEKLLRNVLAHVFQVTGALNGVAAVYYEEAPHTDEHMAMFDMYNEVGMSVGKVLRYTLAFDPKEIHYDSGHQYGLRDGLHT